ncbi:DUF433 domain-containing protein [Novosphingobium sp. KCTC 2891]|uniref:DUF433 domain-containing protein n=1 Tax=Novosphingobium sp. KCTC 2891 TaxID=2989730 RepID=UPI002222461A|nr:DUF433 domain-containing protein [Novosphingobium sp. KCTC 2891]MCW1384672.1 DUF433 domain-containing protein [Novosphingobium sp. KCTC 2891]
MTDEFSAREVAFLADVSVRAVDKAIEERVLAGIRAKARGRRRMLPLHAVPYAAIVTRLPVMLSLATKRDLVRKLSERPTERMTAEPLEIAPAVVIDVPALVGSDLAERAERYGKAREDYIVADPEIMGGTPVLRGTRMTVYAILGRLEGGDTIADIIEDNPHLSREALETAALYARTHPLVGRPGGRPWAKAA